MITPIVSSLVYSRNLRAALELVPPGVRKLWKDWDLRVTILISLIIQILLSFFGNRRKNNQRPWIRGLVWSAYTAADSIATFALGILSSNITDIFDDDCSKSPDSYIQLTTFWAQFLLLHLGGADSITAYALEDNALWMRHFLGLITQTSGIVYIFLLSWTDRGSHLWILSILIFIAGLIKYGERTWVLRAASNQMHRTAGNMKQRKSVFQLEEFMNDDILSDQYLIKSDEGYIVGVDRLLKVDLPVDLSGFDKSSISDEDKLLAAYRLLNVTKRVFGEVGVSSTDRDVSQTIFRNITPQNAFEVVEIHLGMMYDLLYTKAPLSYTYAGLGLRIVTILLTWIAFVLFIFLDDKRKYLNIDLSITFLLLGVALLLEIYAALVLLASDRFRTWLVRHQKNIPNSSNITKALSVVPKIEIQRWSNSMPQYALLEFNNKEKPWLSCGGFLNIGRSRRSQWNVQVNEDVKNLIFRYFKDKAVESATTGKIPFAALPTTTTNPLQDIGIRQEELEYRIIIWNIVTEVSYYLDRKDIPEDIFPKCRAIKRISRYMLYLLVEQPSMLSAEIGMLGFAFQDINRAARLAYHGDYDTDNNFKTSACEKLRKYFAISEFSERTDEEGGHVFDKSFRYGWLIVQNAIKLVEEMETAIEPELLRKKWDVIGRTWMEMLGYAAASKCRVNEHAKQLRRGGEFLSHVWLLMTHLGLTHHFQISEPRPIVRLFAK
ncbi:hypothetical protein ACOSP7_019926 [Xanthoceras sorbifolium]